MGDNQFPFPVPTSQRTAHARVQRELSADWTLALSYAFDQMTANAVRSR